MTRQVSGLQTAFQLETWPPGIPRPRARARSFKAIGLRYEAAVARQLPAASRGLWWEFRDRDGPGLCQTDLVIDQGDFLVVLECKHTWTPEGMDQLVGLYLPVVGFATGKPAVGIQVCKHLVPWAKGPVSSDLGEALRLTSGKIPSTLHWRGVGPLQQQTRPQLVSELETV